MTDQSERLAGELSAMLTVLTTEHFTLQTARSSTVGETVGRAGMYLTTVSTTLVALAFAGEVTEFSAAFTVFGLVAFLSLLFVGFVTFQRVVQVSMDDIAAAQRINRVRRRYLELLPALSGYLEQPAESDDASAVLRQSGMRPSQWQLILTVAGMVSVINSVILGVLVGAVVALLVEDALWLSVTAGALAFLASVLVHHRVQLAWRTSVPSPLPPLPQGTHSA
jgi:ABC-type sugar transport system permease subunit